MTTISVSDVHLLGYPSLSWRLSPGGGQATLDLGVGVKAPAEITLHGRTWTLRYTDTDVEVDDPEEDYRIQRVTAVYDEYSPVETFLENLDAEMLEKLVAPLVSETAVGEDPADGAPTLVGNPTLLDLVNWELRYSYSAGWLSDGTGTTQGEADLKAGKPLTALVHNLLADARGWPDMAQRLQTVQLAAVVKGSAVEFIDLTDPAKPRAAKEGKDVELLSPWSERIHAADFDKEKIRCYYWPAEERDYEQSPVGSGDADRLVDDVAHDHGHARAEILLQREQLKQSHNRATVSVPSDLDLGIDLYEVISHRGRYWRVMEIEANFGETDAITTLTMMFIGDVPVAEPEVELVPGG